MIEKRISLKLDPDDIFIYDNQLLKTASVNLPDNIPYDPNFLYVEVRAVSAGEYYGNNKNIDFFPEDQLNPPKNAGYGKETFMNAHVFKNHDNKDVANAIGDVLRVIWDDEMKGVNLLIRIDKKTSPSVARGFEAGYITDVSMGCRVHHVVCSICGHNARTKADYCNHLKMDKGKIFPDGRKVQEINIQPKFHDISVVLNGAEKVAKVTRIYRDTNTEQKKVASLTTDDMTRIALDLGISKHASAEDLDGMLKLAGFENGLAENLDTLASHNDVRNFISEYIENSNRQNITKIALEQEFDKFDPKKQAFNKLATIQKLSEFEKRIEGEIIRTSAKAVEDKMQAEVDADDAFTDALHVAKMRSFKELGDEECDEISKKLLAISEEKRIPRFEILRSFFTVLATQGIHLTLTEFAHLTMHVLKGMAFEGDHEVFERKIGDYRAKLTQMIMDDIRRQEIMPGTGLHNVQNALRVQPNPLGMDGLDKMIMALSGSAPLGIRAIVRRPMMKVASYQEGACSPAGICGSDMTNEVIFDLETMVSECTPLADRNRPIMSYAADLVEIAEMEKTAIPEDLAILGERIYWSKGKLKDLAFGKVKDGEAKGQNRFNHAYDTHITRKVKQHVGQMFGDSPEELKAQDDALKGVARKATWQAAKRPLIASAGLAAAGIYGAHKVKAARAKRLAELEEKSPPKPEQKERLKKELRHSNLRRLGTAGLIAGGYGSIGSAANKVNKNINELKEHYGDVSGVKEWHPGYNLLDEWVVNDEEKKKQEQFAEKANKNIKNFENRRRLGKGIMIGGAALGAYDGYRRIKARRAYRKSLEPMQEKTAAREDFVPTKNYGWTQKMPRSYSQWEKFQPKTTEEWDAWEDWQNSVDHGDGDDWDKERWKQQKHFAETGETASAWIARSAHERQAEAERRMAKQQRAAATRKKWMKPIAGAALGAAGLGLTNSRKRH